MAAVVGAGYLVLVLSTINAPPPAQLPSAGNGSPRPTTRPSNDIACLYSLAPVPTTGADGSWVVAGAGTGGYVGYRAAEILAFSFVRAPNDAVGRTTEVVGQLTLEGNVLTATEIRANVAEMHSDIDIRDGHLHEFLHLDQHPQATFTLTSPVELGEVTVGKVVQVSAAGDLTLLDVTHPVVFPLQARWDGDSIQVAGQLVIKRSDFDMDIPQLLGFYVAEEITLELSLTFVRPGAACAAPTANVSEPPASSAPTASPGPDAVLLTQLPAGWGEIAFLGLTGEGGEGPPPGELYVLREGQSAPTAITATTGDLEDEPAWSADGRLLAYTLYPPNQPPALWVAAADGSDPHAASAAQLRSPAWSADGRFLIAIPADELQSELDRVELSNGAVKTILNDPGTEASPDWSPDGQHIVLSLLPAGGNDEDIYMINADGTGLRGLTSDPAYEYQPRWSPDGRQIAFVRGGDLWLMNADGGSPRQLTSGLKADSPTWSPDGLHLAFVIAGSDVMSGGDERRDLWFVDADGTNLARMRFDLVLVAHPAWRP